MNRVIIRQQPCQITDFFKLFFLGMTFQVEEMYWKKTVKGKNYNQTHKAFILDVKSQQLKDSAGKIDI